MLGQPYLKTLSQTSGEIPGHFYGVFETKKFIKVVLFLRCWEKAQRLTLFNLHIFI